MTEHIDALERLAELRRQGMLTELEFDQEKARLFNRGPTTMHATSDAEGGRQPWPRSTTWLLGIGAALPMAAGLYLLASQGSGRAEQATDALAPTEQPMAESAVNDGDEVAPQAAKSVAKAATGTFEWAVSPAVIGLNPAYVESKLGIAKAKGPTFLEIDVEGCAVSYSVKASEIVSAYTVVSGKCQPVVDGTKITPRTTFGSLMESATRLVSNCVYNCGNAADPSIELYKPGYRANNNIEYRYNGRYGDVTYLALDRWEKAIRLSHGLTKDDYENEQWEWFHCASNAPADVMKIMRRERVAGVTIGRDLVQCVP